MWKKSSQDLSAHAKKAETEATLLLYTVLNIFFLWAVKTCQSIFFLAISHYKLSTMYLKQIYIHTHKWGFPYVSAIPDFFSLNVSDSRQMYKPFFFCCTTSNIISLYGLKHELLTTSVQLENITQFPNHCMEKESFQKYYLL